ncbi:hypothetical protein Tco_1321870, partial [Tanacetum coccineum]
VSPVDINPINSSAYEEGGTTVVGCENDASIQKSNGLATLEKEMETRETVKSVGSKKMTRSIRKDSSRQDSQSQENVSPLLVLPQEIFASKGSRWFLDPTRTYPPLDECQLWETLGSTISVSMKDMNTSLWNWNSTYGFYQYCPMASIVSYSLVICASAWYLNNGSIEYHENSFLIIYSLGKYFKGAHSFGLASCCTPCVSNVSSLWSVMLS